MTPKLGVDELRTTAQPGKRVAIETEFNHTIDKLKMTRGVAKTDQVKHATKTMDAQLKNIMAAIQNLFLMNEKPVGKISAYMAWKKKRSGEVNN